MKNYVKDPRANTQLNVIAHLIQAGLSDEDIADRLNRTGHPHLASDDAVWNATRVREVIDALRLDGRGALFAQKRVVVRTYRGSHEQATASFRADSAKMASNGYIPTVQQWVPGTWGCGAFLVALLLCLVFVGILVFIYLLVVKPDGTLSVTYERRTEHSAPDNGVPANSKTCPRCAEDVKAAAAVCRYCGHEFA